eukprot:8760999-Alexandrium_andersonii.AAC.1
MDSPKRPRFQGDPATIVEELAPLVQESGRSWIRYSEERQLVDVPGIKAVEGPLAVFQKHQANLAYSRSALQAIARGLLERFQSRPSWAVRQPDIESYVQVIAKRLTNVLRVVHQAELKSAKTPWVASLPWHQCDRDAVAPAMASSGAGSSAGSGGPGGAEVGGQSSPVASRACTSPPAAAPKKPVSRLKKRGAFLDEASEASQKSERDRKLQRCAEPQTVGDEYTYGWDSLNLIAWRVLNSNPKHRELSVSLEFDDSSPDSASPVARFRDGDQWEVSDITVGELRNSSKSGSDTPAVLWEGEHVVTHAKLQIRPRPDRFPLLSLYEQKRQVELGGYKPTA